MRTVRAPSTLTTLGAFASFCTLASTCWAASPGEQRALATAREVVVRVARIMMSDDETAKYEAARIYHERQGISRREALRMAIEARKKGRETKWFEVGVRKFWVPPGERLDSAGRFVVQVTSKSHPPSAIREAYGVRIWERDMRWGFRRDAGGRWKLVEYYGKEAGSKVVSGWREMRSPPILLRREDGGVDETTVAALPEARDTREEIFARKRAEWEASQAKEQRQARAVAPVSPLSPSPQPETSSAKRVLWTVGVVVCAAGGVFLLGLGLVAVRRRRRAGLRPN